MMEGTTFVHVRINGTSMISEEIENHVVAITPVMKYSHWVGEVPQIDDESFP